MACVANKLLYLTQAFGHFQGRCMGVLDVAADIDTTALDAAVDLAQGMPAKLRAMAETKREPIKSDMLKIADDIERDARLLV